MSKDKKPMSIAQDRADGAHESKDGECRDKRGDAESGMCRHESSVKFITRRWNIQEISLVRDLSSRGFAYRVCRSGLELGRAQK
jgi:hypothetical protein